jgi:threonine/homoserine/homoserine lactone efflux protein
VSVAFLVTTLIVVASPGTGALITISAGLARGRRASVVAAFGCTLGILPHMAAAIVGVAALLYASSVAFQTLKLLGVAYLLFMAWSAWRERGPLKIETEARSSRSSLQVIVSAILANVLNPKLSIFFFAFLPQFVRADDPHRLVRMLELSSVFMVATFVVFVAYGLFAAAMRSHVLSRPKVLTWMRRTFAGGFVALGAKLALTTR